MSTRRRRFWFVAAAAVVVVAGLGVAAYFFWPRSNLPGPGSPAYLKYVDAFEVGVAALDLGEPTPPPSESGGPAETDLAFQKLTEAVETVPAEPAGWADRGLWYLRKSQWDKAATDLGRAERLAPDSPQIQNLLGLLDKQQGKYHEAVSHLRKALEKKPKDLLTLYTLAQMLETEGAEGSDAEVLKLLDAALAVEPNNLLLLREKTKVAARLGDRTAVGEAVATYKKLAPEWTSEYAAEARAQLKALEKQASEPLPGEVPDAVNVLDNFLTHEHGYARDAKAVDRNEQSLGEAVQQFLRLKPMRDAPAAPDLDLTFDPPAPPGRVAEAVARSRWDLALPVWLTQDAEPVVFVADAKEVLPRRPASRRCRSLAGRTPFRRRRTASCRWTGTTIIGLTSCWPARGACDSSSRGATAGLLTSPPKPGWARRRWPATTSARGRRITTWTATWT